MRAFRIVLLSSIARGVERGFFAGIAKYSSLYGPWTFYREPYSYSGRSGPATVADLKAWKPHGAICAVSRLNLVQKLDIPVIALEYNYPPGIPGVVADDFALGRLAAQHLLNQGFDNFAFCGIESTIFSQDRCRAFCSCIVETGHSVEVYRPKIKKAMPWNKEEPLIRNWLKSLQKPIGLCCANDDRATQVLELCSELGYGVPEDIAVVGVDNDPYVCELSNPPLSSVAMAADRAGYESAELLHRLMLGEASMSGQRIVTRAEGVVARQSTDILMVRDPNVRAALRFIRENINRPIQVRDIVRATEVSHRTLTSLFYRECGSTIVRQLTNARIAHITRLLRETELPVGEVAQLSGFDSDRHFARYFRASMNQTPNEYRTKFFTMENDGPAESKFQLNGES